MVGIAREVNILLRKRVIACFFMLGSLCVLMNAQNASTAGSGNGAMPIHATHVLGFEGLGTNVRGTLAIEGGALQFQKSGRPTVSVSIASIEDVVVGSEDKQVGGVPMVLGKAALPYGGGRVVSLASHKKFDTLTLQYLDGNGGFHGAIFRLAKGQGQILRNELIGQGAHVSSPATPASQQNSAGGKK